MVLLMRHAEYDVPPGGLAPDSQPLNEAGKQRAQALAHVLAAAEIQRIYVSGAVRTQQTASPLSDRIGVPRKIETPAKIIQAIQSGAAGQNVLVVGHSNTVPEIIRQLGGSFVPTLVEGFDNLFVLSPGENGSANLVNLKYGKPSA